MAAVAHKTSAAVADGEIVWSWPPGAEVKSFGMRSRASLEMTGAIKPVPGEITYKT
jgi:hypothetical protein